MIKIGKKVISAIMLICIACSVTSFVGCGGGGGEKADITKTQIYVSNYDGGIGTDWLRDVKTRFEEANAAEHFEDGKTGVQIMIDPNKKEGTTFTWDSTTCEVVFNEKITREFLTDGALNGRFMDLTDVMDNILAQDGVTLADNIKDMLTSVNDKYYAIPHYEGGGGITYDKDLFHTKRFYIAKDGSYVNHDGDLSAGPDGLPDTDDDGLPATIKEFLELCKQMKRRNVTPLIVSGQYKTVYLDFLLDKFSAGYNGRELQELNYNYSGTNVPYVDSLTANASAVLGYDLDIKSAATVDETNGYLLKQQPAKYYALALLRELIVTDCFQETSWRSTVSQLDAQERFIKSTRENGAEVAMYLDGIWWTNEATDAFKRMESTNQKFSKKNRNFGWMPLPVKVDENDANVGDPYLTLDSLGAYVFARSGLSAGKQKAIKAFIEFCYTKENLEAFTVQTGMTRPFTYPVSDENKNNMSDFEKDIWYLHENGKFVYVHSDNMLYSYNEPDLFVKRWGGLNTPAALNAFAGSKPKTAAEYFEDTWYTPARWQTKFGEFLIGD